MDDWLDLLKGGIAGVIEGELQQAYGPEPQIVHQGQSGAVRPAGQMPQTVAGVPVLWLGLGAGALLLLGLVVLARR